MNTARPVVPSAVVLVFAITVGACSVVGGKKCEDAYFELTPTTGTPHTESVEACTHDPAKGDCHLEIFEIGGSQQYIQYSPYGINSSCEGVFEAQFVNNGTRYDLYGNILRVFGTNRSEPFASGMYNADSGESGTFLFYEDELADL